MEHVSIQFGYLLINSGSQNNGHAENSKWLQSCMVNKNVVRCLESRCDRIRISLAEVKNQASTMGFSKERVLLTTLAMQQYYNIPLLQR